LGGRYRPLAEKRLPATTPDTPKFRTASAPFNQAYKRTVLLKILHSKGREGGGLEPEKRGEGRLRRGSKWLRLSRKKKKTQRKLAMARKSGRGECRRKGVECSRRGKERLLEGPSPSQRRHLFKTTFSPRRDQVPGGARHPKSWKAGRTGG